MLTWSRINEPDHKINNLTFADDIVILENDTTQAQLQLNVLNDKTVQMHLNMNDQIHNDNLINRQPIATLDNFRLVGS